ncbi:MAG: proline--tRNA ligase [Candidatus Dadabacteria bacterium]|nr:MAG: proline--tRNA ligase [Candidatus Dadabacteria bacterium]
MRQSIHLGKTLKETPKDAQTQAHILMLRAGYIRQVSAGVYTYMPLLHRVLRKISQIIREEMDGAGAEELTMPAIQPSELWIETGRWERYTKVDGIMFSFKDRRGATVCLGPTHEEIITDIIRNEVSSYRDLPKILYQIQTKFRDEIRPRFGLLRAREFIMKDAYSFDRDREGLDSSYEKMRKAYNNICSRIGFEYREVEADSGAIGGAESCEFMVLADTGEDTIIHCPDCGYAANQEKADSKLRVFPQDKEELPMEEVYGKGLIGVEKLAEFLNIPVWKTTKTLLYEADDKVVAVMVRGDCEVNEVKVMNYLGCGSLRLASPEKIKELTGAEVGYAGPIGLPNEVRIIADEWTKGRVNFECGANKTDYHNINVNFERDLPYPEFGDFKLAEAGHLCPKCDHELREEKGIEVGHIFKLGTKYSEAMKATYLDQKGKEQLIVMGCYGIGVTRIAAAIVEQNHDDRGIVWPISVAPYEVHLIGLNLEKDKVRDYAESVYEALSGAGIEVLFDDRDLRAGEKFSDCDLIGIPIRFTVSSKTVKEDKIEVKFRRESGVELYTLDEAISLVKAQN